MSSLEGRPQPTKTEWLARVTQTLDLVHPGLKGVTRQRVLRFAEKRYKPQNMRASLQIHAVLNYLWEACAEVPPATVPVPDEHGPRGPPSPRTVLSSAAESAPAASTATSALAPETCPRCGLANPHVRWKQVRSADEDFTVYYLCADENCAKTWHKL